MKLSYQLKQHSRPFGTPCHSLVAPCLNSPCVNQRRTSFNSALKALETQTKGITSKDEKVVKDDDGSVKTANENEPKGPKEWLKKYGPAYVLTSLCLALFTFSFCYTAVNAGVDTSALLQKLGLNVDESSQKVGTIALAFACNKALEPARFPFAVAATPKVAEFLDKLRGKKSEEKKAD